MLIINLTSELKRLTPKRTYYKIPHIDDLLNVTAILLCSTVVILHTGWHLRFYFVHWNTVAEAFGHCHEDERRARKFNKQLENTANEEPKNTENEESKQYSQ